MARDADIYQEWIQYDGRRVKIDGLTRAIRVSVYNAVYPVAKRVITVFADVVNKNSKAYRQVKEELGDDWSTDVLESDVELQAEILSQLRSQE